MQIIECQIVPRFYILSLGANANECGSQNRREFMYGMRGLRRFLSHRRDKNEGFKGARHVR